jgi:hypothetical protein
MIQILQIFIKNESVKSVKSVDNNNNTGTNLLKSFPTKNEINRKNFNPIVAFFAPLHATHLKLCESTTGLLLLILENLLFFLIIKEFSEGRLKCRDFITRFTIPIS